MKRIILYVIVLAVMIIFGSAYAQSNVKTWAETLVQDFSDNQLTNLVVTNNSGGEVQFPHPLVRITEDYDDNSVMRFISKDSVGNFVYPYVQDGDIYVQKYSATGETLSAVLRVNEVDHSIGENIFYRSALMNDGIYLVVWINTATDYNMCGQLFKDDSVKVGSNFIIKTANEHNGKPIEMMANNYDDNFWVFYPRKISDKFKISIQKVNKSGSLIGEVTLLNQEDITLMEILVRICSTQNYFWAAWDGSNNNVVDDDDDLYLRRFNYDGTPVGDVLKVSDKVLGYQGNASMSINDKQNLFISWVDEGNMYGQVFNKDGVKIGNNTKLNSNKINQIFHLPFLNYKDDEFLLSWQWWDGTHRRYVTRVSHWIIKLYSYGEMISSVYCADPDSAHFEKIDWNMIAVPQTNIKFKIRTGKTMEELNNSVWYGPTNTSGHYLVSGNAINPIHNGDCYIQYKALFSSLNGNSAILNSVGIAYTPADIISPSPPSNLMATASYHKINLIWQSNSQIDLLEYILYRGTVSGEYDSTWKAVIPADRTVYEDTTVVIGLKYYYVITAVDSSHNESACSEEVSATAWGVNLYVSTTGSTNGDGSITNPFLTIQQGLDAAASGDTVRILPGNYGQTFKMKNRVSLVGTDVEKCKIYTIFTAADSCVIKSLTITQSVLCNYGSPLITENIFTGTSPYGSAIVLPYNASPIISKNFIRECRTGIAVSSASRPLIKNNIIKADYCGIEVQWADNVSIINNSVIAKSFEPLTSGSWDTVTAINNIFVTLDEGAPAYPDYSIPQPVFIYNDFWNTYQTGTQVPSSNSFLDPQFESFDLQNYHLLPSSPCINAGDPDPKYNDVDGSRNDMGAYGGPDPIQAVLSSQLLKSIYVSNLSAYPQDTITVDISLDNAAGLAKAEFVFEFDPAILTFEQAKVTTATQNFSLVQQTLSAGQIKFVLSSAGPVQSKATEILKVELIVNVDAQTNDASSLMLKNVSLFDANLKQINIRSITDGAFVVNYIHDKENYIHVDSHYEGIENGSREQPFNTIMEAVAAAVTGDSILVHGGDYYETVAMKEGIPVIGSGAAVTNLTVGSDQYAVIFENIQQGEFSGFTIRGVEFADPSIPLIYCSSSSPVIKKNLLETPMSKDFGISCVDNSNAVIEANYIKRMGLEISQSIAVVKKNIIEQFISMGVVCWNNSTAEIEYNVIKGDWTGDGVSINDASAAVNHNLIYCSIGEGAVYLNNAVNSIISNNIIKDRGFAVWSAIRIINSTGNSIINNSIITHYRGIEEQSSNSTILNNIIMDNSEFGVKFSPASDFDYNDIWNNNVNYFETTPGVHDLSADPMFADTAKGDYRLAENSPCVNSGHPYAAFNDPDGSRNDMGAYGGPNADYDWLPISNGLVAIDSVSSMSTDTILVTIAGKGLEDIIEFDFSLSYDRSLLTAINANNVELTRSFSLQKDFESPGSLQLCLQSKSNSCDQDGELVKMYFVSHAQQSVDTWIRFDSVKVKDEATYLRKIYNLNDGKIKITVTGMANLVNASILHSFKLYQNYPNPFNPVTIIRYEIPMVSKVSLKIYDVLGREVITLFNGNQKAGKYEVEWRATNFASGIYFYHLQAGDFSDTKKLILLR